MKIACLGWGSLIWDSRNLDIPMDAWAQDGPLLPIEFTRISKNNRVTLIIDNDAALVPTLWAILKEDNLPEAVNALAEREGVPNTKFIPSLNKTDQSSNDLSRNIILKWLKEHHELDAVVWTGLSYKNKVRPTMAEIIQHLQSLKEDERVLAKEYVRRAPKQIDTEYRREIVRVLGWTSL